MSWLDFIVGRKSEVQDIIDEEPVGFDIATPVPAEREARPKVCLTERKSTGFEITYVGPWNETVRYAMSNKDVDRRVHEIKYGKDGIETGRLIYQNYDEVF